MIISPFIPEVYSKISRNTIDYMDLPIMIRYITIGHYMISWYSHGEGEYSEDHFSFSAIGSNTTGHLRMKSFNISS